MVDRSSIPDRANYGVDAPTVIKRFFVLGGPLVVGGLVLRFLIGASWSRGLGDAALWMGGSFLFTAGVMLWGSRYGKLRLRDSVLDSIEWNGDEQVLDVGCGHGLMLIGAARRLKRGSAVGIDLWQKEDQAGNYPEETKVNARIEGVADRVELKDGDARDLPFGDETFDVVLSSWALHNIYDADGRRQALEQIVRVLKPGGRLVIVDIKHTSEYADVLRELGMRDVKRKGPNFLFMTPTYRLSAAKSKTA
jgi:SAM-dependent methyltransferase